MYQHETIRDWLKCCDCGFCKIKSDELLEKEKKIQENQKVGDKYGNWEQRIRPY